jgi:hypothetical protein
VGIQVIEQTVTAGNNFDGASGASTGSITVVAGSALVDGESFFLSDGKGLEVEFRFRLASQLQPKRNGSSALVLIPFDSADLLDTVRDRVIAAVNGHRNVNILASNGGAGVVSLVNRLGGTAGNRTPTTDTVVDAGFVVTPMSGGLNRSYSDLGAYRSYDPAADGGQFDFPFSHPNAPTPDMVSSGGCLTWLIDSFYLDATTATDYTINALSPEGVVRELATGSGALVLEGPFLLTGDERVQLITTGATGPMVARVAARPELPLPAEAR